MPYHIPPRKEEPEPQVSREEMLAIRDATRENLVKQYHSHRMTARLYRRLGRPERAAVEEAEMQLLRKMIAELSDDDEATTRLLEGTDS